MLQSFRSLIQNEGTYYLDIYDIIEIKINTVLPIKQYLFDSIIFFT